MIWEDRQRENPKLRKIVKQDGTSENVTIEEVEDNVTVNGTPLNAVNMNTIEKNIGTYGEDLYDSSKTYNVGNITTYQGIIYRCKTAIETPEEFNLEHWEEYSLNGQVYQVRQRVAELEKYTHLFKDKDTFSLRHAYTDKELYYKLCNLKESSSGTDSCVVLRGNFGGYSSNTKCTFEIQIGSRDNLRVHTNFVGSGDAFDIYNFVVYKEPNDTFTVYLKALPNQYIGTTYIDILRLDCYAVPASSEPVTPTGTLITTINKELVSVKEQEIGTWIDGKRLFRKIVTMKLSNIEQGVWGSDNMYVYYNDFVSIEWAQANTYDKTKKFMLPFYAENSNNIGIYCYIGGDNLIVRHNSTSFNSATVTISLLYTI